MTEHTEGHTVKRYDGELAHLRGMVLEMGGLVLAQVDQSIILLEGLSIDLANGIIIRDKDVNELDVRIHHEILELLARRAPVATDLRTVLSVAKVITELERMGDEIVKISRQVIEITNTEHPPLDKKMLRDAKAMGKMARTMLRDALNSFDSLDLDQAIRVARWDLELDNEFQAAMRRLTTYILEDYRNIGHTLNIVLIIKAMERVGDHTKNIAEYVVYMVKGKDVRHTDLSKLFDEVYAAN